MATQRQTLTVQLCNANIRIAELESQLISAEFSITALTHELAEAQKPKAQSPARIAYLARPRAEWVRPAHMEAARQAAMATGRVTRV